MPSYLLFLLVLALWIWAFVDCLLTPEERVRYLPKVVWVLVILLFGEVLVGPVVWLVLGRGRRVPAPPPGYAAEAPQPRGRVLAPDDDPEFLAALDRQNKERARLRREEELRRASAEDDASSGDSRPENGR